MKDTIKTHRPHYENDEFSKILLVILNIMDFFALAGVYSLQLESRTISETHKIILQ